MNSVHAGRFYPQSRQLSIVSLELNDRSASLLEPGASLMSPVSRCLFRMTSWLSFHIVTSLDGGTGLGIECRLVHESTHALYQVNLRASSLLSSISIGMYRADRRDVGQDPPIMAILTYLLGFHTPHAVQSSEAPAAAV